MTCCQMAPPVLERRRSQCFGHVDDQGVPACEAGVRSGAISCHRWLTTRPRICYGRENTLQVARNRARPDAGFAGGHALVIAVAKTL